MNKIVLVILLSMPFLGQAQSDDKIKNVDTDSINTKIDKQTYYSQRGEEDAKFEQQYNSEDEKKEKEFWKEQKAYEKDLKKRDKKAYKAYKKGKEDAYREHYEHCDSHCHHSTHFYYHASYYNNGYNNHYYYNRHPRYNQTRVRISTPSVRLRF